MKKHHVLVIGMLVALTIILSACAPGPRVVGTPGISLSDDRAFVAYGNSVFAMNAENGAVEWYYPESGNNQINFYAQPYVTDQYIYVGDLASNFHKIEKGSGSPVWTFSEARGFFIGQANEENGIVYAPSNDGNLYAIDSDGILKWAFETEHFLWAQPQIGADAIYLGSMDHFVYAISKDGEEIWSTKMAGAVVGAPALNDDGSRLFVGSLGEEMVALDTSNGSIIWTYPAADSIWGRALCIDETLYFADTAGIVYALDAIDGDLIWQQDVAGSVIGGIAALPDGIVLVTEEGSIKTLNFDGSPMWEATLSGRVFQAAAVNDQTLVVGIIEGDNLVYAYNLTGTQVWSSTPEK
jgi:outer membrane protein assembly factor BamB